MESRELPVEVTVEPKAAEQPRWRLRILLGFSALVTALYVISRLEPEQAQRFGPLIASVYNAFNPPIEIPLSESAKELIEAIRAMGGHAGRNQMERRLLGLLSAEETFTVSFNDPKFDDQALAWLATKYADRITSVHLMNTGVTDNGLSHLKQFRYLRFLNLASFAPVWVNGKRFTPITDAGMAQLDLPGLAQLNLDGLLITDASLKLLPDLPNLSTLQLTGTQVQGHGLSRLATFPKLNSLHLSGSAITDEGLGQLAGASNLLVLSLDGVQITAAGLKRLAAVNSLRYLSIRGCQIPDADVAQLKAQAPLLRIER